MTHQSINEAGGEFSVPLSQLLVRRATSDGTPFGPFNVNGDYSVTPQVFYAQVPPGEVWYVRITEVFAQGSILVRTDTYGPSPALANGVVITFTDGLNVPLPGAPQLTAGTTADYEEIPGSELTVLDLGAGGLRSLAVELSTIKSFGSHVVIREGQRFAVIASDDMTGLTRHVFTITGHVLKGQSGP